jgi:hypothetical protein
VTKYKRSFYSAATNQSRASFLAGTWFYEPVYFAAVANKLDFATYRRANPLLRELDRRFESSYRVTIDGIVRDCAEESVLQALDQLEVFTAVGESLRRVCTANWDPLTKARGLVDAFEDIKKTFNCWFRAAQSLGGPAELQPVLLAVLARFGVNVISTYGFTWDYVFGPITDGNAKWPVVDGFQGWKGPFQTAIGIWRELTGEQYPLAGIGRFATRSRTIVILRGNIERANAIITQWCGVEPTSSANAGEFATIFDNVIDAFRVKGKVDPPSSPAGGFDALVYFAEGKLERRIGDWLENEGIKIKIVVGSVLNPDRYVGVVCISHQGTVDEIADRVRKELVAFWTR